MRNARINRLSGLVGSVLLFVAWGTGRFPAQAAEVEPVTVTKGGMQAVDVSFAVKGYSVADKAVVRAESDGSQKLRFIGLSEGTTAVQVTGEGNQTAQYNVSVVADIAMVLTSTRKLLEEVPGVEARVDQASGRVIIEGFVNSLEQSRHLEKVVSLYAPLLVNLAKFDLTPEAKKQLTEALEKAGLKVVEANSPEIGKPGVVSLSMSQNSLAVSGMVLNKGALARIEQVLSAQQWMLAKSGDGPGKPGEKVVAVLNVAVDSRLLELGVAYVGISETEFTERTGNLLKQGLLTVNNTSLALQGQLAPSLTGGFTGQYELRTGLDGALRLLSGDSTRRSERVGHLTFKNNAEGATFHDGGTLKVKVTGQVGGDLKDIPYGLDVKVNTGFLSDAQTVDLVLNTSVSLPRINAAGDYDLSEQKLENIPVSCKLGQTLILAGSKQTLDQAGKEGVPLLRQIPIINWFTSDKTKAHEEIRLLVLINPQLGPAPQSGAQPYSDQTRPLQQEMGKPLK